jgi:ribosomal protein S27AE
MGARLNRERRLASLEKPVTTERELCGECGDYGRQLDLARFRAGLSPSPVADENATCDRCGKLILRASR